MQTSANAACVSLRLKGVGKTHPPGPIKLDWFNVKGGLRISFWRRPGHFMWQRKNWQFLVGRNWRYEVKPKKAGERHSWNRSLDKNYAGLLPKTKLTFIAAVPSWIRRHNVIHRQRPGSAYLLLRGTASSAMSANFLVHQLLHLWTLSCCQKVTQRSHRLMVLSCRRFPVVVHHPS